MFCPQSVYKLRNEPNLRGNKYCEEHKQNTAIPPARTGDGISHQGERENSTHEINSREFNPNHAPEIVRLFKFGKRRLLRVNASFSLAFYRS